MAEHQDDPAAEVTLPDGRVIRNLTDEEYAETLNDPGLTLHSIEDSEDESGGDQ